MKGEGGRFDSTWRSWLNSYDLWRSFGKIITQQYSSSYRSCWKRCSDLWTLARFLSTSSIWARSLAAHSLSRRCLGLVSLSVAASSSANDILVGDFEGDRGLEVGLEGGETSRCEGTGRPSSWEERHSSTG